MSGIDISGELVYNRACREQFRQGKAENSVKTGRLCHFPCEVFSQMGGDCYEPIHKNIDFYYRACNSTYYKSKIAPTDQVRAILKSEMA